MVRGFNLEGFDELVIIIERPIAIITRQSPSRSQPGQDRLVHRQEPIEPFGGLYGLSPPAKGQIKITHHAQKIGIPRRDLSHPLGMKTGRFKIAKR